jgi:hypothetical protein
MGNLDRRMSLKMKRRKAQAKKKGRAKKTKLARVAQETPAAKKPRGKATAPAAS